MLAPNNDDFCSRPGQIVNLNNEYYLEIIASLKTTIEVLEAELLFYRSNSKSADVTRDSFSCTKVYSKKAGPVEVKKSL